MDIGESARLCLVTIIVVVIHLDDNVPQYLIVEPDSPIEAGDLLGVEIEVVEHVEAIAQILPVVTDSVGEAATPPGTVPKLSLIHI